ncbi:hypothetical protein BIY23_04200 [Wolbachia pipientis]|uniref:SET domain-containing protein n=1 Tax=Wolbachia pipientis TaxID=955 RepID=A0A1E7QJI8_WOLPI|nr:SET domain-containing protein-lysine N-methyltransferase [Wolbachia pipientis]OEY86399.1 hypothetical protein BIY23_04200 [Wolbachia pipientis]
MSKNSQPKNQARDIDTIFEKIKLKLQSLHNSHDKGKKITTQIRLSFITSICGTKDNKLEYAESLNNNNYTILYAIEQAHLKLTNISSMLNGVGAKAPETLQKLAEKLVVFNNDGTIEREKRGTIKKTDLLKALEEMGINLSNISSMLNGTGAKAPETLQKLVEKLVVFNNDGTIEREKDGTIKKTNLLKTLEEMGINLSNISSMLNGTGAKAPETLQKLVEKLVVFNNDGTIEREKDGTIKKTNLLKALEEVEIDLSNISSMLRKAGAKAPETLQKLVEKLVVFNNDGTIEREKDGTIKKTNLLKALEEVEIDLSNISSMLNGTGAKAPETLQKLAEKLVVFNNDGTIEREKRGTIKKTDLLKALEEMGINLSNISSMLSGAGAKAPETLQKLAEKLVVFNNDGTIEREKGGTIKKTDLLKALEEMGINLSNISSMLNGTGAKAPETLQKLVEKLVVFNNDGTIEREKDGTIKKTDLLKTLEEMGINLSNISSMLHKAGAKAPETLQKLAEKLVVFNNDGTIEREKDGTIKKTNLLKALEEVEIDLSNISSMLNGVGAKAPETLQKLAEKLVVFNNDGTIEREKDGTIKKTNLLKALEEMGINLSNISSMLHKAGAKAPETLQKLVEKLVVFNNDGTIEREKDGTIKKTDLLKTLEEMGINLSNISSMLNGTGAKAPTMLERLVNVLQVDILKDNLVDAINLYNNNINAVDNNDAMLMGRCASDKLYSFLKEKKIKINTNNPLHYRNSNGQYDESEQKYQKEFQSFYEEYYEKGINYNRDILRVKQVDETDHREALRGQDQVIATKDIPQNTVLGIYTGTLLCEDSKDLQAELEWLLSNNSGAFNKITHHAFDIVLYEKEKLMLSGYCRGNPLIKINANHTYDDNNTIYKIPDNVAVAQCRYNSGIPFILFTAKEDIKNGEELLFDYGCRYWQCWREQQYDISTHDAAVYQDGIANKKLGKQLSKPSMAFIGFIKFLKANKKYNELYKKLVVQNKLDLDIDDKEELKSEDKYVQEIKINDDAESIRTNTKWRLYEHLQNGTSSFCEVQFDQSRMEKNPNCSSINHTQIINSKEDNKKNSASSIRKRGNDQDIKKGRRVIANTKTENINTEKFHDEPSCKKSRNGKNSEKRREVMSDINIEQCYGQSSSKCYGQSSR